MSDVFIPEKHREVMSRIRGRDTKPERIVRSMLLQGGVRSARHVVRPRSWFFGVGFVEQESEEFAVDEKLLPADPFLDEKATLSERL